MTSPSYSEVNMSSASKSDPVGERWSSPLVPLSAALELRSRSTATVDDVDVVDDVDDVDVVVVDDSLRRLDSPLSPPLPAITTIRTSTSPVASVR